MSTHREKLSILSEMIAFARVNKVVNENEYNFLLGVSSQLEVDRTTFDSLFETEVEHIVPKTQVDRILQFHRLVLLMNFDKKNQDIEVIRLHNIGLGMGLPPSAIEQVLAVMHRFPDKMVPPDVLIDIFKAHYN